MDFPYRCEFPGGGYDLRHATLKGRNKKVKADLDSQHGNGATKSANSLSSCYHFHMDIDLDSIFRSSHSKMKLIFLMDI